jgi:hypothetical protein
MIALGIYDQTLISSSDPDHLQVYLVSVKQHLALKVMDLLCNLQNLLPQIF